MVEQVGYTYGSLPMTDEGFIMVDLHIYIFVEEDTSKDNMVSLVDIAYQQGFVKDSSK